MNVSKHVALILFLCCVSFSLGASEEFDSSRYMKLDEVRPGMTGIGKTVLKGNRIEEFSIEVVDVIRNVEPSRSVILIKVTDEKLKEVGIVSGMSGSPIYVDGRLIGALSNAWVFAKEPFAGLTPIEEMLRLLNETPGEKPGASGLRAGAASRRFSAEELAKIVTLEHPLEALSAGADAGRIFSYNWRGNTFSNLCTPAVGVGFSRRFADKLNQEFNSLPVAFFQSGKAPEAAAAGLEPGSVIVAKLIEGDIEFGLVGTVTDVIGDRVLAFGHSLILAEMDLPMAAGMVSAIVPSRSISFKIGQPTAGLGRIALNSNNGALGILGETADMIDASVTIRKMSGDVPEDIYDFSPDAQASRITSERVLKFTIVKNARFTPSLLMDVLQDLYTADGVVPERNAMQFSMTIDMAGHDPVVIRDAFSGPGSISEAARSLAQPLQYLMQNNLEEVDIKDLDAKVLVWEGMRVAELESLKISDDEVKQGETLKLEIAIAPYQGEKETIEHEIAIPEDAVPGKRFISACDFAANLSLELRENMFRFEPETIDQAIDVLNTERKNTSIFLRISPERFGLVVDKTELPNLPVSVLNVLSSTPKTRISPLIFPQKETVKTSYVIRGQLNLPFTILKKEK
jgi:hypothetical protein